MSSKMKKKKGFGLFQANAEKMSPPSVVPRGVTFNACCLIEEHPYISGNEEKLVVNMGTMPF